METRHYWEENGHSVKYDNYNSNDGFGRSGEQLNFAAPSEDEAEFPPGAYLKKGKVARQDPMSHRIIEKRRRDRMNNCLADLSRLIPPEYLKKGRGRVEKTEIIEMAIRHLKFLQERVNACERQAGEEHFRAGYQEAVGEAIRYLAEGQGFPAEGLCAQLAAHLQRHCELITKGDAVRDKGRSLGSSETASSSSSSMGYAKGVIQPPPGPPPYAPEHYENGIQEAAYPMECDRVPAPVEECMNGVTGNAAEAEGRREPPRKPRKPEHDDYIHSYKFKNSIERRFSRSQDTEAVESVRASHGKAHSYKRRRAARPAPAPSTSASATSATSATSASASASAEEARDTSPQDTSSESPHHHQYEQYEKPPPTQYVPVFALNALGKYYVPLSVEYACVSRQLRACEALEARAPMAALHPVTIHVNFSPCLSCHVKREPDHHWRPV